MSEELNSDSQTSTRSLSQLLKRVILLGFSALALLIAVKLIWVCAFKIDGDRLQRGDLKTELIERRAFLLDATKDIKHIRSEVPPYVGDQIAGEMVISTCCQTTIALTNLAFSYPETREESLRAIRRLIQFVLAPEQREFDNVSWNEDPLESLDTEDGHVWYLGNVNFMIGAFKFLGGGEEFDPQMKQITAALCRRYLQSDFPMIESYPEEYYSPDNVIAIASIANAGKLLASANDAESKQLSRECTKAARDWLGKIHKAIDHATGAIAFRFTHGKIFQGARGIGVGWNCHFLPFIDNALATEQYEVLKKRFAKKGLGIFAGLREYPDEDGEGDVDSGPVILGLSMSGTGFGIGAARRMNDPKMVSDISFTVESAGSTVSVFGKRHYLLAPLVGEAVMLAMYSSTKWDQRFLRPTK